MADDEDEQRRRFDEFVTREREKHQRLSDAYEAIRRGEAPRADLWPPITILTLRNSEGVAQTLSVLEKGRAIAEQKCAPCHAIGRNDERPHAIVTPFRDLHTRYPIEMLIDARKTRIISGHDEMPMFELSREDMRALLGYIDSFTPHGLRYVRP